MILRRIGVGSAAKLAGVMYALIGLIVGLVVALISLAGSSLLGATPEADIPSWFGAAFGVGAVVLFPILYGIMGVIAGVILAVFYNLAAGMAGGVELELQDAGRAAAAVR